MQTTSDLTPVLAPLWELLPSIVTAVSGAGALSLALALLGQVAGRQSGAGGALASAVLSLLGAAALVVVWRGVAAHFGAGTDWAEAGGSDVGAFATLEPLLGLLDRLLAYELAVITFGITLVMAGLVGPAETRGRAPVPASPGGMTSDAALGHLRRVKAELKGRRGEDAVIVALARLGLPALHDVVLPDARGLTQVDHLVRLPGELLVLETKTYAGLVTGTVRDREWVQHLRGGMVRTTFQNPLLQNHRHVEAVRCMAGAGVPVRGVIVSAGKARFSPELEGAVVLVAELAARLEEERTGGGDPVRIETAWHELTVNQRRRAVLG